MKAVLWLVKLYWLWIIVGVLILIPSFLPPGISLTGIVIGAAMLLWGLVARKAMTSDSLKNRIDRNL